jgi:hypoxanthine phosphoribosyltransferase
MEPVFSPEEISLMVKRIAGEIDRDYENILKPEEKILVLGVLNGGFIFMADLIREISLPVDVDFIRLSSYQDSTSSLNEVVMLKAPEKSMKDRHVLVVEDLADCGLTLNWLRGFVRKRGPATVKIAVAVDKTERRRYPVELDYAGFVLKEGFLVGYGLDYAQNYRNLKGLYHLLF